MDFVSTEYFRKTMEKSTWVRIGKTDATAEMRHVCCIQIGYDIERHKENSYET